MDNRPSSEGYEDGVPGRCRLGWNRCVIFRKAQAPAIRYSGRRTKRFNIANPPFKSSYSKFQAESVWLVNRGLSKATLKRHGVFQYENPA